jgi:hypothetical protein
MIKRASRFPLRHGRLSGLMLLAVVAGAREGAASIWQREGLIAGDMVSAIEHILDSVRGSQRAALAELPVPPLYVPTGGSHGLLYVIESAYLTDALAHGVRYGAGRVVLSVPGAAALDDRGTLFAPDDPARRAGARATSSRWGFSIDVTFAPSAYREARWRNLR